MTRFHAYLLGLVVLFGGYVAVEYFKPEPTNWNPTFQNNHKIPYGTYVLYKVLPELFGRAPVRTVRQPVANQLLPNLGHHDFGTADTVLPASTPAARVLTTPANYVFINSSFSLSRLDRDALLRYVARGNYAFIATEELDDLLADTLRLHLEGNVGELLRSRASRAGQTTPARPDSLTLRLLHPAFKAQARFRFPAHRVSSYFEADSACQATVLAFNDKKQPVLVQVPYGKGNLILSSTPAVFSNYFLLRPATAGFGFGALSYLPRRTIFWDEYQKQGPLGEQSLLRVVMEHEALRWAWYLLLFSAVLFVLSEGRRRQRVIPVLKPLPNTTLLFTRTVASLYRQGNNHAPIAEKKISLFLEFLRTRFQEPTPDLNDAGFRERLAQKAGITRPQVDELIRRIQFMRTAPSVSHQQLLELNKALTDFRRAAR